MRPSHRRRASHSASNRASASACPFAALAACCVLIPAAPVIRSMFTQSGAALDPNLGRTGKILVLYSVLFSVGWVL